MDIGELYEQWTDAMASLITASRLKDQPRAIAAIASGSDASAKIVQLTGADPDATYMAAWSQALQGWNDAGIGTGAPAWPWWVWVVLGVSAYSIVTRPPRRGGRRQL